MNEEVIGSVLAKYRERSFVEKLWAVVTDPKLKAFKWTENGKSILIDFMALDDYLFSEITLFDIPDRVEFFSALKQMDFKRVDTKKWDTPEAVVDEYEHPFFQRDDEAALKNFTKTWVSEYQETSDLLSSQRTDPCFQPIRRMSRLHEARLRFDLVLDMALMNKAVEKGRLDVIKEDGALTLSREKDAIFELQPTFGARPLKDDLIPLDQIKPAPEFDEFFYKLVDPSIMEFLKAGFARKASVINDGASSSKCTSNSHDKVTSENATGKYERGLGEGTSKLPDQTECANDLMLLLTKPTNGGNPDSLDSGNATQSAMGPGKSDEANLPADEEESNEAIEEMVKQLCCSPSSSKCISNSHDKVTSENVTGKYERGLGEGTSKLPDQTECANDLMLLLTKPTNGGNPDSLDSGNATQSAMGPGKSDEANLPADEEESNEAIEEMVKQLCCSPSSSKCISNSHDKVTSENVTGKYERGLGEGTSKLPDQTECANDLMLLLTKPTNGGNPDSLDSGNATQSAMGPGKSDEANLPADEEETNEVIDKMMKQFLFSSDDEDMSD